MTRRRARAPIRPYRARRRARAKSCQEPARTGLAPTRVTTRLAAAALTYARRIRARRGRVREPRLPAIPRACARSCQQPARTGLAPTRVTTRLPAAALTYARRIRARRGRVREPRLPAIPRACARSCQQPARTGIAATRVTTRLPAQALTYARRIRARRGRVREPRLPAAADSRVRRGVVPPRATLIQMQDAQLAIPALTRSRARPRPTDSSRPFRRARRGDEAVRNRRGTISLRVEGMSWTVHSGLLASGWRWHGLAGLRQPSSGSCLP